VSHPWPHIALGQIAKPVTRPVSVVPGRSYRTIGVKWWGEGAYERETIDGSRTAARTLSIVRKGDLIINKIWVRHGSTAIASAAVDGCTASGEFPTFELDLDRIAPEWIHWQTKTPDFWAKCDALSRGTSGKNRIKPELFLTIRMPLPSLADQRIILAHIDALDTQIQQARRLREEASNEISLLFRSILASDSHSILTPMHELVRLREPDVIVRPQENYHFAGVYSFGRGVFRSQTKSGMEFAYPRLHRNPCT
jgi:type I restriction enzyme S subunit